MHAAPASLLVCCIFLALTGAAQVFDVPRRGPFLADASELERPASISKIHPDVTRAAGSNQSIKVFVVLADQTASDVVAQANQRFRIHELVAEGRLHRARSLILPNPAMEEPLQRDLDSITLSKRRFIFQELNARFTPQQEEMEGVLSRLGALRILRHVISNMLSAELPVSSLSALESDPRVLHISPVTEQMAQLENSVPAMRAPFFWNLGFTGTGESVAFLDSGAYAAHPAFGGKVTTGIFIANNRTCSSKEKEESNSINSDFQGHGTHVGGIIGSIGTPESPNRMGVARGLSRLYSLKISCEEGRSFSADSIAAAEAAIMATPVTVMNNSNGGMTESDYDLYSARIDRFVDLYTDFTWINAAGNDGPSPSSIGSPATAYNSIAIANWDSSGGSRMIATSSSRGPTLAGRFKPDLAAPGTNIFSLDFRNNGFVSKTGTSMAAPHVAGAAALIRQAGIRGRLGIKALLLNSTSETGWQTDRGWGYINLEKALREKDNVFPGELSPATGSFVLLHGSNPISVPFKATLVWNRFVGPRQDESFLRNINLWLYDTDTNKCSAPQNVVPANPTSLPCVVTNSGDLPAFDPSIEAAVIGSESVSLRLIGDLQPRSSSSTAFTLLAPSVGFSGDYGCVANPMARNSFTSEPFR